MSDESPFVGILRGKEPGKIIAQDDAKQFAIIECIEPEAAVHWLAIPYESGLSTEGLERRDSERFAALVEYAIRTTKVQAADYPELQNGFTVKFHVGSFETIPHPKLHILSTE